jgi:hypothetical protein
MTHTVRTRSRSWARLAGFLLDVLQTTRRRSQPIQFIDPARSTPIDRRFGRGRGTSVDRRYIDAFFSTHRTSIQGDVVEVSDRTYTDRFGTAVRTSEVLTCDQHNPLVTVRADLGRPDSVPERAFDCFICPQTIMYVPDYRAAVQSARRMLREGGTALVTASGISPMSSYDDERWGDFLRFTPRGMGRLFGEEFGEENVEIAVYGNALSATCLIQGVAVEDLPDPDVLDPLDPIYPVIIGVKARRAE